MFDYKDEDGERPLERSQFKMEEIWAIQMRHKVSRRGILKVIHWVSKSKRQWMRACVITKSKKQWGDCPLILELLIGQLETSGWSSALSGFCEVRGRPCAEEERVGTGRRKVQGEEREVQTHWNEGRTLTRDAVHWALASESMRSIVLFFWTVTSPAGLSSPLERHTTSRSKLYNAHLKRGMNSDRMCDLKEPHTLFFFL